MRTLTPSQIIDLWERGTPLHPIDRALALVSFVRPEAEWEELVELSIGERDRVLLEFRKNLFGRTIEGNSLCPDCGERVEFHLDIDELIGIQPNESDCVLPLDDGHEVEFRLPNSRDLATILSTTNIPDARLQLAERCLSVNGNQQIELTEERIADLARVMEERDPLADIQLDLLCPECQGTWSTTFDILIWLWQELTGEATGLLREVHLLASSYGWDEESILSMSSQRRQTYIEMIY